MTTRGAMIVSAIIRGSAGWPPDLTFADGIRAARQRDRSHFMLSHRADFDISSERLAGWSSS
ncbi:MAG TPA: hypothetical protein VHX38_15105 [Pseudonocardiaceae bacterium]|jgi:hypothetical protein|nr:hypothetical protein [Pseudonocardiaceae bacterium]